MTVYISKSYKNESDKYQVVCNTSVIVFEGSAAEAQAYLDDNPQTTAYADAAIVAPGETLTGDYVAPEQYLTRKAGKEYMAQFFAIEN